MTVFYSVIYNTLLLLTYFDAYLTLSEPVGSASRWLLSFFDMSFLDHIATSNFIPTLQRLIFCRDTFSPFLAPLTVKNLPMIILNVLTYLVNLPVCGRSAIFIDPPPSHNSVLNFKTMYVEALLSPLGFLHCTAWCISL